VDSASRHSEEVARNVATVRRTWEAFNATAVTVEGIRSGDLAPVLEALDRGVVMDTADLGVPGLGQYHGHRGVRQFWLDWFEVVGEVHTEVREIGAAGDKVVTICRQSGTGMGSGVVVTWDFAMIVTLRDARVVRIELSADLDEARRMVGLETVGA
jgi:ketosteroid isomerase-like protein